MLKTIIQKIEKEPWDKWIVEHESEINAGVLVFIIVSAMILWGLGVR